VTDGDAEAFEFEQPPDNKHKIAKIMTGAMYVGFILGSFYSMFTEFPWILFQI
jgi:hypothetical protein